MLGSGVAIAAGLVAYAAVDRQMALAAITRKNALASLQGKQALIVGGSNGIGKGIAVRLAQAGCSVTVMGRSPEAMRVAVEEMRRVCPDKQARFDSIATDATEFASVRASARRFADEHPGALDILVTSQGAASMKGFTPNADGVDNKLALHYFGRVLFWRELYPLMHKSSSPRLLTVLSAGVHAPYADYESDFALEKGFSLQKAADAAGFYNDLAVDAMTREHPRLFAVHAAPGLIATNYGAGLPFPLPALFSVAKLFANSIESCAEFMCDPLLSDSAPAGTFLLMDAKAQPALKTKLHTDRAVDFVWAQTKRILGPHG